MARLQLSPVAFGLAFVDLQVEPSERAPCHRYPVRGRDCRDVAIGRKVCESRARELLVSVGRSAQPGGAIFISDSRGTLRMRCKAAF